MIIFGPMIARSANAKMLVHMYITSSNVVINILYILSGN